ncbi:MAG: hypothetical protein U1U88_000653 [Lawsonella clevelandensis]
MTNSAEQAVVTLWFVSAPDAHALLASNPQPDAEYGLQLVAGLFPDKPVTPLGTFPSPAPLLLDTQRCTLAPTQVSLCCKLRPFRSIACSTWYPMGAAGCGRWRLCFAQGPSGTFAGFAHWHQGKLERAFSATACEILKTRAFL